MQVPGEERYIQVLGEPVRYYAVGNGPPVVLLHGLGEAALVWYENITPLAQRFSVYAPDLLGHGRSGKPRQAYTTDLGVAFVTDFLDALELPSAHLVGNSMGGLLAASVALDYPDRVRTLALEGSAGLGRETAGFLRVMTLPLVGELLAWPTRSAVRRMLRMLLHDQAAVTDDLVEALYEERRRPGNRWAMLRMLRAGVTFRGVKASLLVRDRLSSLQKPTLLLWGRQDPIMPVEHAELAAQALPMARLHIFEQCGHWPHLERHEEFNQVLLDFLAEQEEREPGA